MAHGCGGGGTSRQVTCVLVLPPKKTHGVWTSHALCPFDSFLQPRWFAEVIWTIVNLLARDLQTSTLSTDCDAAQNTRLG